MISLTKIARHIEIAIVCTCFVPLTSWAASDSARIRAIVDSAIRPLMTEYDVPGLAVGVTIDGQSYFFNYGVASREEHTPVSQTTLFELGSISKTFTATLATYAQVLGKLSLDDHPGQYMPLLKGTPIDQASLLNLGTYTAGDLPLQFPDEISDAQMTDYFRQWKPHAPPGEQRKYSNPSIGLLGHITALALKTDFNDAIENQLFPQLGLKGSYIRVPENAMASYAWGYDKANRPIRVKPGVFDAQAYGIKSTAADMIRYVQVNLAPQRLEGPIRNAVEGTHTGFFKTGGMVQALGWERYACPVTVEQLVAGNNAAMIMSANVTTQLTPPQGWSQRTLFNKTGSTNGFGSYVAFVPEEKIGIVLLANRNYPIHARITAAHAILGQLVRSAR